MGLSRQMCQLCRSGGSYAASKKSYISMSDRLCAERDWRGRTMCTIDQGAHWSGAVAVVPLVRIGIGTIPFHPGLNVKMVLMVHITISGVQTSYLVCIGKSAVLHAQETNKNNMSSRAAVFKKGLLFNIACKSGSRSRPSHAIFDKQRLAPEMYRIVLRLYIRTCHSVMRKGVYQETPQVKSRCCFPPGPRCSTPIQPHRAARNLQSRILAVLVG